jgi:type II secretory pathway component GspD/PulD (secretin)
VSHPYLSGLLIGLSLLPLACVGPEEVKPEHAKRELTAEEFRDLLAKGTIQPTEAMVGEDPFKKYGDEGMGSPTAPVEGFEKGAQEPAQEKPPAHELPPHKLKLPVSPTGVGEANPPDNPYLTFGERIKVNPDGTVTKPYPLRVGTGEKMKKLIEDYGNFPMWVPPAAGAVAVPSTPGTVKLDLLPGWDVELYQDLRTVQAKAEGIPLADWLVVTTGQELLYDVEDFINLFAAGVPQIEIEAKIVEIIFSDSLDLGVTPVAGKPMFDFPGNGTFVKSFSSTTPNGVDINEALLTLGGVFSGTEFNAILEAIATNDNVSIISRPKIAVREGGRADISNIEKVPYLKISTITGGNSGFTSSVEYQEVGVRLYVVPRVIGTKTVALNIDIEASQQSGTEVLVVTGSGDQISAPRLSQRSARTVVYLQPGQAVILGGLVTERNVESIRKVPLLGDIPVLQYLFRSKFTKKEQANVLFFIRPRILQGVDVHREF